MKKYFVCSFQILIFLLLLNNPLAHAAQDPSQEDIKERIQPVGKVFVGDSSVQHWLPRPMLIPLSQAPETTSPETPIRQSAQPPVSVSALDAGKRAYESKCVICHGVGLAGSPKFGDKQAWQTRADKGMAVLLDHAIHGFNAMPPKGTCTECSDKDLEAAIRYMATQSGAKVD